MLYKQDNFQALQMAQENVRRADIKYGGITFISRDPRPGYIPYQTSSGKTVYLDRYESIEGYIDNMEFFHIKLTTGGFVSGLDINFNDYADDNIILRVYQSSRAFDAVLKSMFNVDFTLPVKLCVWTPKNKTHMAVTLYQNNVAVKHRFTKDNLEDAPPAVVNPITGALDFTAHTQFILDKFTKEVIPKVKTIAAERKQVKALSSQPQQLVNQGSHVNHGNPVNPVNPQVDPEDDIDLDDILF